MRERNRIRMAKETFILRSNASTNYYEVPGDEINLFGTGFK